LIFLINLYTLLVGISRAAYTALFNLYLKSYDIPNTVIGNATFYYSWGMAIGGFLFAGISDKIGRKKTILFTMPLYGLFGILRLLNLQWALYLYLVSFLFGFFDTSVIMPTISVIENSDEKKRLRNSNINFAIVMITGVIGYFGAGVLSERIGLYPSLNISMVLAILSVLPVLAFPNVRIKKRLIKRKNELSPSQLIMLIYYISSGALVSLAAGVFINFGNVIFYDLFSFSTAMITVVLAISQLSTAATSLFSHKLTHRYGYKLSLFLIYLSVSVLIFLMPIFMLNSYVFSIAYILRYVLINISTPLYMVFCLSYLPRQYIATYSGLSYFVNNVMRAVSAQIFTKLSVTGETDYNKLFGVTGLFYLLNTLLTLFVFYLMYKVSEQNTNSEAHKLSEKQNSKKSRPVPKAKKTFPLFRRTTHVSIHIHTPNTTTKRHYVSVFVKQGSVRRKRSDF